MRNTYAIGLHRGRSVHFLKVRESNFRRACKTLRDTLKENKRYRSGFVYKVVFGKSEKLDEETGMIPLYFKELKK